MDPRVSSLPQNRGKPKPKVENLCPFGCQVHHLDPNGYCPHLAGWTVDKKTMEVRERLGEGRERTGHLTDAVRRDDTVVPMATDSSRVYRREGGYPLNLDAPPAPAATAKES